MMNDDVRHVFFNDFFSDGKIRFEMLIMYAFLFVVMSPHKVWKTESGILDMI